MVLKDLYLIRNTWKFRSVNRSWS